MEEVERKEVTRLLRDWHLGDAAALQELVPLVHGELKRLARHYMQGERKGHLLQTTALINEAFIRLLDLRKVDWANRDQFIAAAAQLMRRILVDFARKESAGKRGGRGERLSLSVDGLGADPRDIDLLALDEALDDLAALDPRKTLVVELRFFGGLSVEETAAALSVSEETVMRDWRFARAWLFSRLGG